MNLPKRRLPPNDAAFTKIGGCRLRLAAGRIDAALLRTVAAAAALCMLLAHGFAFTNLFPNHDSTVLVFDAQWTMYVLGRWAQNLYFPLVRGKIAAPWLIGAFSIVYLALTGYIIAKLLHLRRWSAALLTGLLGTCASVTAQLATYTYETDAYLLAMLLACAAVWCSRRLPRLWGYAGAAVLADQATLDAVGKKAAVQAMPNYPAQGYCAMVDGTAVIKLSD